MPRKYDGDTPDLSELILLGIADADEQRFHAIPCEVVTYDPARQCADLSPVVKQASGDGESHEVPELPCVPVLFPKGGGFSITWDLLPGDTGLVVVSTVAISQWIVSGTKNADPEDTRRASLADAIFIPGVSPFTAPLVAPLTPGFSIGKDDGTATIKIDAIGGVTIEGATVKIGPAAVVGAGKSDLIDGNFGDLKTYIDTHTHSGVTTGPGASGPPLAPSPTGAATGSAKLLIE